MCNVGPLVCAGALSAVTVKGVRNKVLGFTKLDIKVVCWWRVYFYFVG